MMTRLAFLLLFLSLGIPGCSGSRYVTVRVPPEVDLRSYQAVGIIEFGSNADATINRYATQRFQSSVQSAQPGTRLVELGTAVCPGGDRRPPARRGCHQEDRD